MGNGCFLGESVCRRSVLPDFGGQERIGFFLREPFRRRLVLPGIVLARRLASRSRLDPRPGMSEFLIRLVVLFVLLKRRSEQLFSTP